MANINVIDAINNRSSKRKYHAKPVDDETLNKILSAAQQTPSGANMQPWTVYAVRNVELLEKIGSNVIEHIKAGGGLEQEIQYYPIKWINPYKKRRIVTGAGLYTKMGVDRKDNVMREKLWHDNYRWFGAQTVIFVYVNRALIDGSEGALIDCGAYMQTLMLAAQEFGVDSCPQGSTTEYGKIIAQTMEVPDSLALLYSVVLGYEDKEAIQNSYQPTRAKLEEAVTFLD